MMRWMTGALVAAAMLGSPVTVGAAPPVPPSRSDAQPQSRSEAEPPSRSEAQPGTVVLGPAAAGTATLVDEQGQVVARLTLVAGRTVEVAVPPGRYRLEVGGQTAADLSIGAGERVELEAPPSLVATVPPPVQPQPQPPFAADDGALPSRSERARTDRITPGEASPTARRRRPPRRALRWAAPLASAIIPGLGQGITGRPGRAAAVFTGTLGLVLGAVGLHIARDETAGAALDDDGRADSTEFLRLGGISLLSGAAGLLYFGQILDAHRLATGVPYREMKPRRDFVLAFEVQRASTVGFSPGVPRYDRYEDWSLAVMGQPVPRVTVGVSDLSIKLDPARDGVVVQGGARSEYRFYDKRRVWLSAGGGVMMQGYGAQPQTEPVADDGGAVERDDGRFSAALYVHLATRIFVVPRWSLNITPRINFPLLERHYARGRTLPQYSTTFELALGTGVHF